MAYLPEKASAAIRGHRLDGGVCSTGISFLSFHLIWIERDAEECPHFNAELVADKATITEPLSATSCTIGTERR
jgi:hypothetical protein